MASYDYHFLTRWTIRGPIEGVFEILKNGGRYADWWPAYLRSDEIENRKVRSVVRAKLPYTLTFTTELIREDPPRQLEVRATGDLVGRGVWNLRQVGEITEVDFLWDVRAEKRWFRWLSPLLRPLFSWNHSWVMKTGRSALQVEILRRC